MSDYSAFNNLLKSLGNLSEEDAGILQRCFKPFKANKKDYLIREGDKEDKIRFIEEGICRVYLVNENFLEKNVDFIFPQKWATSFDSFLEQSESREFIQCLTDMSGYQISYKDLNFLYENYMHFNYFGRIFIEQVARYQAKHIHLLLSLSPEKRFQQLLSENCELLEQIPSKHVASYIGVTEESFSRLKKRYYSKN